MSKPQPASAVAQPTDFPRARRSAAAVIAQYIKDLSSAQSGGRSEREPAPAARVLPARVLSLPC